MKLLEKWYEMNKKAGYLYRIGRRIMFVAFVLAAMVVMHEQTHKSIFKSFNCHDIVVKYGLTSTTTANCSAISEQRENSLDIANSQMEIVGYNVIPWLILIFLSGVWGAKLD